MSHDGQMSQFDVCSGGIAGRFFGPVSRPRGAVIVLGGSGGGIAWSGEVAAQLAVEGYATLALAYFRRPGANEQRPVLSGASPGVIDGE